jgi:hypothetical protein
MLRGYESHGSTPGSGLYDPTVCVLPRRYPAILDRTHTLKRAPTLRAAQPFPGALPRSGYRVADWPGRFTGFKGHHPTP